MTGTRSLKQGLSRALQLWEAEEYDRALAEVAELLKAWPGNPHLYVMWASLVQLQEEPAHSLDDVKKALRQAVEVDPSSPAAAIELAHYLDAVEDNPRAAVKAFAEGVAAARKLLIEGLLGQARALLQLNKRADAIKCLMESMYLAGVDYSAENGSPADATPDVLIREPTGRVLEFRVKGPFADKIEDVLREAFPNRSA